jgi:hypothetical protein
MSLRVSNSVEKNVVSIPMLPIAVADSVAKDVLPSAMGDGLEYTGRYIQNVGAKDCYYAFGHDCNNINFDGILVCSSTLNSDGYGGGQQLDCSNTPERVSIFSRGGTTISVTLLKRNDLAQGQGNIL